MPTASLDTGNLISNLSYLHPPPLSTAVFKSKGSTRSPWCQSASCWLIGNNRLITAFHPSFLRHPAEPGSRPDLLAHPSCLPSATYYSWRPRSSLGEHPAQSPLVQPHWNIRQGWAPAGNDMESSEPSRALWHLPTSCAAPRRGAVAAMRACYMGMSTKEMGEFGGRCILWGFGSKQC